MKQLLILLFLLTGCNSKDIFVKDKISLAGECKF